MLVTSLNIFRVCLLWNLLYKGGGISRQGGFHSQLWSLLIIEEWWYRAYPKGKHSWGICSLKTHHNAFDLVENGQGESVWHVINNERLQGPPLVWPLKKNEGSAAFFYRQKKATKRKDTSDRHGIKKQSSLLDC